MVDHDIQKSRHLLKHLEEEMIFLSSIVAQIENLSAQAQFVSSGIKRTWSDIDHIHKDWIKIHNKINSQDIEKKYGIDVLRSH